MSYELIHTSVERGLRGVSGFATAVATRGLPAALEPALEELSAYDFDANRVLGADRVDWAHRIVTIGGRSYSVLSRTAPSGSDWSGRANRLAHHIALEAPERGAAGPAQALAAFKGFADRMTAVEERAVGPSVPRGGPVSARPAAAWSAAGFDAGWAGVVARMLLDAQSAACYLILPPDTDALPLLEDVYALLPEERRWHITFSTRFQRVGANTRCQLRCVRKGAPSLRALLSEPGVRQVQIEQGVSAGDSESAEAGRRGIQVEPTARASVRVDPVLRRSTDPRNPTDAPAVHRAAAGDAQASDAGAFGDGEFESPRPSADWSVPARRNAPHAAGGIAARILFGIAAVALLASFIIAVLIVVRRS